MRSDRDVAARDRQVSVDRRVDSDFARSDPDIIVRSR
jgi:hypothetical protein